MLNKRKQQQSNFCLEMEQEMNYKSTFIKRGKGPAIKAVDVSGVLVDQKFEIT